jgi:hypothetical protein
MVEEVVFLLPKSGVFDAHCFHMNSHPRVSISVQQIQRQRHGGGTCELYCTI